MKKLFIFGMSCFIVFFVLGTLVWFFIEQRDAKVAEVDQTFNKDDINQLVVNTDVVNVTFKAGQQFHVHYKGADKLNVTRQGKTLQIMERLHSKRKMLNLNPFVTNKECLVVTIPPNYLKNLSVTTQIANIDMKGIQLDNVMLWNDMNGEVNINDCQFKNAQIKGEETLVNIRESQFAKSDIYVESGLINTQKFNVQQSLFKVDKGDMHLLKMAPQCNLKGVVNQGDIEMSYAQPPQHVRLMLSPTNGDATIQSPHLKQGLNGQAKHQVELYTNDGDIVIR